MKITFREMDTNEIYGEIEMEGDMAIVPSLVDEVVIEVVQIVDGGLEIITNLPCIIREFNMPFIVLHTV